ncbi:DoxX family membrane protein [Halorarum halophilum]|uniref:DoxX family membrane protein n=1 Tax=Halorarum halophilum TaxID=2743090 RepID=A0A7D5GDI6_9EURY|nr:DoxX family membrane protein [Halobaculum halophilum]QLG26648.1 DoxX family membrane protein [Halobaculum halophilum]
MALRPTVWGVLLGVLSLPGVAAAHVEYVTEASERGDPVAFLVAALGDPVVVGALAAGAVAVIVSMAGYLWFQPFSADVRAFRRALSEYEEFLPWLFRLSLGLPMVGAGYAGYLFTPLVTDGATAVPVRPFGVAVGFLLLFGLATRAVALVALVTYVALLPIHPDFLFAFEYSAGLVAVLVVGSGRPSADHLLTRLSEDEDTVYSRIDPFYRRVAVPFDRWTEPYQRFVPTIVRVGMGAVFVYLALAEKLLAPEAALAVVDKYGLTTALAVPPELWVLGAAFTELFIGALLLVGFFTRAASAAAFAVFTTTLFALPDDPVLAHISLFGLVSALLVTGAGPFSVDMTSFLAPDEHGVPAD